MGEDVVEYVVEDVAEEDVAEDDEQAGRLTEPTWGLESTSH